MKKIEIKFLGLGYDKFYQANIKIYDIYDNLIYDGSTYNGKVKICLYKYQIYRLKAISLNDTICTNLYISDLDNYVFIFDRAKFVIPNRKITFLLTDYYYNLPIEKGELYLWQK